MDWKKIGKKLMFPPVWLMGILTVICAGLLTVIFIKGWEETPLAYGSYAVSFYTLTVVVLYFSLVFPKSCKSIRKKIYAHPLGNRYMTDQVFRMKISLFTSLSISLMYVGVNLWSWFWGRSWWFVVLAVYYTILAVMRFLLVRRLHLEAVRTAVTQKWKTVRLCACILLLLNLCLSGAVLMILYQDRGREYPGIMIYVMAMYAFYATTYAIVSLVRYRRIGDPILSMSKVVSLSAALVSMLNLETAMFAQFGKDMPVEDQQLMIMLTGAGISITVVALAIYMILRSTVRIQKARKTDNGKESGI